MLCCGTRVCEVIKKQFIAGAHCPQCNALDKVKLCRESEREWLECVACGKVTDAPAEPEYPNAPVTEAVINLVRFPDKK
jgi:uncharacterized metal-binding protein (TIGR02443 family)